MNNGGWALAFGVLAALAFGPQQAHAGLLNGTGDFNESLDVPHYRTTGPLVLQSLGRAIDGTAELTTANTVSNPSNYQGVLNATLGDATLILAPSTFNDYQVITFSVSNIAAAGQVITGFTQTGSGAINASSSAPYTEALSFTANSITVSYTSNNISGGDEFYLDPSGQDTFQIATSAAVPEPGSLPGLLAGMGGLALVSFGHRLRYSSSGRRPGYSSSSRKNWSASSS